MSDRTSGAGGERRAGRRPEPPDEDWTPEDVSPGERAPDDPRAANVPREPLPEERLPGEPAPTTPAPAQPPPAEPPSPLPGSVGPGREGLTGDDLTPEDAPAHPPGPAGLGPTSLFRDAEERTGDEERAGDEGLRPGTEDLASGTGAADAPGGPAAPTGSGTSDATGSVAGGAPGFQPPGSQPPGAQERHEGRMPGGESTSARGAGVSYGSPMPDDGLGVPETGEMPGREAHGSESPGSDAWPTAPGAHAGSGAPLLPHEETDRWERRMRELAAAFVDDPREVVEEADHTLEEIAGRFEAAVEGRRRTLRRSWEEAEDRGPGAGADTEQLRLALRDYRDLAERLLHI